MHKLQAGAGVFNCPLNRWVTLKFCAVIIIHRNTVVWKIFVAKNIREKFFHGFPVSMKIF